MRLPAIHTSKSGRMYILFEGKKKYLKEGMTKKQLKAFIKLLIKKKKKKAKKKARRTRKGKKREKKVKVEEKKEDVPVKSPAEAVVTSTGVPAPPPVTTASTTKDNDIDFLKTTLRNELRSEFEKEFETKKPPSKLKDPKDLPALTYAEDEYEEYPIDDLKVMIKRGDKSKADKLLEKYNNSLEANMSKLEKHKKEKEASLKREAELQKRVRQQLLDKLHGEAEKLLDNPFKNLSHKNLQAQASLYGVKINKKVGSKIVPKSAEELKAEIAQTDKFKRERDEQIQKHKDKLLSSQKEYELLRAPSSKPSSPVAPEEEKEDKLEIEDDVPADQGGEGRKHDDSLFDSDIRQMMKKIPDFIGVVASDEISSLLVPKAEPHSRVGFIMNLDKSYQAGSHWVAVLADGRPNGSKSVEYFDPFGDEPTEAVLKQLKELADKLDPNTYLKLKINRIKHQQEQATSCGYHAMNFLLNRIERNKSFSQATGFDERIQDKSGKYEKEIQELKHKPPFDFINHKGSGIVSTVKDWFSRLKQFITGRKAGSPELMKFIEKHGGEQIKSITVCRQPITPMINKVLNIITLGKFSQVTRDMHYDKLYHLFLVFRTDSGSYITERNEIVRVYGGQPSGQTVGVSVSKNLNVADFFTNGIKRVGEQKFFTYHPVHNNCQDYLLTLLSANGLNDSKLTSFIKQDIPALFSKLPNWTSKLAKGITDFASRLRVLIGQGREPRIGVPARMVLQNFRNNKNTE